MNVQRMRCVVMKKVVEMNRQIRKQIQLVLEDDNEVMTAALDSDLDDENKRMNRELTLTLHKYCGSLAGRSCVKYIQQASFDPMVRTNGECKCSFRSV